MKIPGYVYSKFNPNSLQQGDILKVDGKLKALFKEFYPGIVQSDEPRYVMVISQTCDLVKTEKRKLKVSHINVCSISKFSSFLKRTINETSIHEMDSYKFLVKEKFSKIEDTVKKLINNSDAKSHFFLPQRLPFKEDMIAILTIPFPFRKDHYEELLKNKVLNLNPEFRAKIGSMLIHLYGRVATEDLFENGWSDEKVKNYLKHIFEKMHLVHVPSDSHIQYLKKNKNEKLTPKKIEQLLEQYEQEKKRKEFQEIKKELIGSVKRKLIELFRNQNEVGRLQNLDRQDLGVFFNKLLD